MTILNRNSILTAQDLKFKDVEVPEWGGTVRLRELTGSARDAYGRAMLGPDGKPAGIDYAAKLAALSIVDENGEPCFTLDDVQALGNKNADALNRVYDAAVELNFMGQDAVEAAKGN